MNLFRFQMLLRRMTFRKLQRSSPRLKLLIIILLIILSFFSLLLFEGLSRIIIFYRMIDIRNGLSYPMNLHNFSDVVHQFKLGTLNQSLIQPINLKYSKIQFLKNALDSEDYDRPVGLLIVVKSATKNYKKRESIRNSWGNIEYLRNTSLSPNLPTKLVFICGIPKDFVQGETLFPDEEKFNDIVLADFDDNYFNNTYKSILALKWAAEVFPSDYQYLLLSDDDMYMNLQNLFQVLTTLKDRKIYKLIIEESLIPFLTLNPPLEILNTFGDGKFLGKHLYMGHVYQNSVPVRTNSWFLPGDVDWKWYVSLEDYPFNMYPPYIPGSAMVLSKTTVSDLYYASFFVKHFWIDDTYLAILAYKMGLILLHNPDFVHLYHGVQKIDQSSFNSTISLHGFQCPSQMHDLFHTRNLDVAKNYLC